MVRSSFIRSTSKSIQPSKIEDGAGSVKIFQYDDDDNGGESSGANWIKLGQTIFGETSGDEFGVSVSLSSDGKIVAIGGRFNSGNNLREAGHVQVFGYDATQMIWTLIGQEIYGDNAEDRFGLSVALSSNGTILVFEHRAVPYSPAVLVKNDSLVINDGSIIVQTCKEDVATESEVVSVNRVEKDLLRAHEVALPRNAT